MTLSLRLFGAMQITRNEQPVSFPIERSKALLIYLAMQPDQPITRVQLATLFWPDRDESDGRAHLRSTLNRLRSALADDTATAPLLETTTKTIRLCGQDLDVDTIQFQCLLNQVAAHDHAAEGLCPACRAALTDAVALYRGVYLHDLFVADAQPFEAWLQAQREKLHDQVIHALQQLVDTHLARGEYAQAVNFARRLVEVAPWHENGHLQLMRALLLSGRRGEALTHYTTARHTLVEELGVDPGEALEQLYLQLLEGRRDGQPVPLAVTPYQGLAAFSAAQAAYFFGRAALIREVAATLATQPVVAMIGASGSGKSSFLHAGLMPFLTAAHNNPTLTAAWQIVHLRPGQTPLQSLAQALLPLLQTDLTPTELADNLLAGACTVAAIACAQQAERAEKSTRLLIIVDQFEELFTLESAPPERKAFLDCLLAHLHAPAYAAAPLTVLLSLRADFMGQALLYRPLVDAIQDRTVVIGPLNRNETSLVIEEPARMNGVTYEPGLVERLLNDVGDGAGRLPLLEFALTLLWERQSKGWITHQAYGEIGQVTGALTHYADDVIARLRDDEQERTPQIFLQLVQPGHGAVDTRRVALHSEFSDTDWALMQKLVDARLVVTNQNANGEETVEVAHESLIEQWHQLQEWLHADRAFRLWQRRVGDLAQSWRTHSEDAGFLLHGAALAEAEQWFSTRSDQLSRALRAFIEASLTRRTGQEVAEAARQERELAQAQSLAKAERRRAESEAHASKRLRFLVAALLLALLVALLASFYAWGQE